MLTTLTIAAGRSAPGADWNGTLEAGTEAAYVTNPQLQHGLDVTDERLQATVDGSILAATELGQFALTPRLASTHYREESDLDINTGSIDLSYQRKLERGQWSFEGNALTDSTVTSELGTTGINTVNRRHYADTLALGGVYDISERLGWQVQTGWQDTRYSDAAQFGLTNYTYASVQTGPSWDFTERVAGFLTFGTDRLNPQTGVEQTDHSVSAQLKRRFTEQYSWRVSAGVTRVDAGAEGSSTTYSYEIGATRQGERVQWDLAARRAVVPIGVGLLATENTGTLSAAVALSERSTLDLAASWIQTDPVTVFYYFAPGIGFAYQPYTGASWGQLQADWRHRLGERWTLTATFVQARARSGTPEALAIGNQVRLGILWQSRRP